LGPGAAGRRWRLPDEGWPGSRQRRTGVHRLARLDRVADDPGRGDDDPGSAADDDYNRVDDDHDRVTDDPGRVADDHNGVAVDHHCAAAARPVRA